MRRYFVVSYKLLTLPDKQYDKTHALIKDLKVSSFVVRFFLLFKSPPPTPSPPLTPPPPFSTQPLQKKQYFPGTKVAF